MNVGAGHYLPTTPTPAVHVTIELLDDSGAAIARSVDTIKRGIHHDGKAWHETSDTRIPPGEKRSIARAWKSSAATRARVTIEVHPDAFYETIYTQRLAGPLYFGVTFGFRYGDPNLYRDPQYAPNAPPHPNSSTDTYPTPGDYRDRGTELKTRTASLYYFLGQRWLAGLHYTHAQDGQSGQFLLPFSTRSPSGCIPGSVGCTVGAGQTVLVDGLGPARAYNSDRITLTLTHNFGLGDTFPCTGCRP